MPRRIYFKDIQGAAINKPQTRVQLAPARQTTTVFTSGNSQAVRLPKAFRLNARTVEIYRRGDEIVLREKPRSLGKTLADLLADLPPLTAAESAQLAAAIAAGRDTRSPQARDFSWAAQPAARTTKLPRRRR